MRGLKLDTINLPGTAVLNESRNLMKGLKDDLKFNISAQSIQEKLDAYEKFIKEENNFITAQPNFNLTQLKVGVTL